MHRPELLHVFPAWVDLHKENDTKGEFPTSLLFLADAFNRAPKPLGSFSVFRDLEYCVKGLVRSIRA